MLARSAFFVSMAACSIGYATAGGGDARAFEGRVALNAYAGFVDNPAVYAIADDGDGQGISGPVRADGRFAITLPAGKSYELLLVNRGRAQRMTVVARISWTSGSFARWAKVLGGPPASLGTIRPIGAAVQGPQGASLRPLDGTGEPAPAEDAGVGHDAAPPAGGPPDASTPPGACGPSAVDGGECAPAIRLCTSGSAIDSVCDADDGAIEPAFGPLTSQQGQQADTPCPLDQQEIPADACGCTGVDVACDVTADCAPGLRCFASRCSVP